MAQSTAPIRRPFKRRFFDLRVRLVPLAVYVVGIGVVAWLWNQHWLPGTFTGEVQGATASVSSPRDGRLLSLNVAQFDRVTKGQAIGEVSSYVNGVDATLEVMRTDLAIMRERLKQDEIRNQLNYQQLLAERVDQQADLDSVHFDLRYVETDLVRTQKLRSDEYIDRLRAQVAEREQLIADLDKALAAFKPGQGMEGDQEVGSTIDAAIAAQEESIRRSAVSVLRAPIDGVVTRISRLEGENVATGESLITISSDEPSDIVGFIRQPVSVEPKTGDTVVVSSRRGNQRMAAEANVLAVGARMELFTRPLRVRGFDNSQERGLPVLISIPKELGLYPGEIVDLSLK